MSKIVCLPRHVLQPFITQERQLTITTDSYFNPLPQHFVSVEREEAEKNPEYKQIIPYCVTFYADKVLRYERHGDETRLHNRYSVGIGGHVHDGENPWQGFKREAAEEIGVVIRDNAGFVGYVNEETTEVGKVHFGALYLLVVETPNLNFSKELKNPEFVDMDKLLPVDGEYEIWSQLVVENIEKLRGLCGYLYPGHKQLMRLLDML